MGEDAARAGDWRVETGLVTGRTGAVSPRPFHLVRTIDGQTEYYKTAPAHYAPHGRVVKFRWHSEAAAKAADLNRG